MKLAELLRLSEKESKAKFCLLPIHPAFYDLDDLKVPPDLYLHHGPYCVFAKLAGGINICSANKKRSSRIAMKGRGFHGVCPNGLLEFVQPVKFSGQVAAVLYGGHLWSGHDVAEINGSHYNGPKPVVIDQGEIKELKKTLRFLAEFIRYELKSWEDHGGGVRKQHDDAYYLEKALTYISKHYSENISLDELASTLRMNPNYLGTLLRKLSSKNFRSLLNEKRIDESKVYLRLHHELNINQIAASCGFIDSNYFSTVFKKYTGMSPRQYRKNQKEGMN